MNRAIQLQGFVFACLALTTVVLSLMMPRFDQQTELIVIAVLIVFLGVPHGALDTIFAKQVYRLQTWRNWGVAGLVYSILAAIVVAIWFISPVLFLSGFLLVSAVHFSGDPMPGTHIASRIAYSGAIIVLPAVLHRNEVWHLFGLLAGPETATVVTPWLSWLAWPWLVALVCSALLEVRRNRMTGLELVSVGMLATLTPPLIGFSIFFCAMHGARHILRTIDYARQMPLWLIFAAGLVPMAIVCIASLIMVLSLSDTPMDARVIQFIFVGLAALTVPHMALVERVRLSGWTLGRGTTAIKSPKRET